MQAFARPGDETPETPETPDNSPGRIAETSKPPKPPKPGVQKSVMTIFSTGRSKGGKGGEGGAAENGSDKFTPGPGLKMGVTNLLPVKRLFNVSAWHWGIYKL